MTRAKDPVKAATPKAEEIEGVLLGSWRGMVQYRCRLCPFDTLDRQRFIEHFANVHPPLEVIDGFAPADPPVGETAVEE
ncbi:MAG: hypothetical protein MOGMAGMI_01871 [Candidatus Omnitrophica bacterium]|nr:hypothetical protein [Candidatus Omnitrophota bacterium]